MINKILLQGRLTKDPELRQTQSGFSNLLFTIAWSEKYKEVETKCFLLCKAWRQTAEFISKYFHKGQEIAIEGHMVSERWGDADHDTTFCVIDRAHFCGSFKSEQQTEIKPAANEFVQVTDDEEEELPFT